MRGFSTIELMVAVAVLAILAGSAIPAMGNYLERNRLKVAAEQIARDLDFYRSEALKRNQNVSVDFNEAAWCYGPRVESDPTCDCTVEGSCGLGVNGTKVPARTLASDLPGVSLNVSFGGGGTNSTTFKSARGTATDGVILVISDRSFINLRIEVNVIGKVSVCAPAGNVSGYPICKG